MNSLGRRIVVGKGHVSVLGVPIDLGGNHRGVDMGPSAIRVAGLNEGIKHLGYEVEDLGNVEVPSVQKIGPTTTPKCRYQDQIAQVCEVVAHQVKGALERGSFPISLGGDHSAALGTIAGSAAHFRERGESVGVVWVDAHTDMNTPETTPSGNVHGMPMACLLGYGAPQLLEVMRKGGAPFKGGHVKAENCAFIGIRDVDETELELVHKSGVTVFTMEDVDLLGAREVMRRSLEVANRGTAGFHFSFDMDGTDPEVAPGVGTPVAGGLSYREAHLLCELAASSGRMIAMDVMETNPALDLANRTGTFAVELILSALGKRILRYEKRHD